MGRLQAEEMVVRLKEDEALKWHLYCNHYPPVNEAFLPVAKKAFWMLIHKSLLLGSLPT
ncbi:unnamed protein product [marine sediment metagenome]|uniref:Uncharacterized protein n=1 Tax=marine sediment metagenome TaxID=412755 RepID=X1QDR5_9ZZZZ